MLPHAIDELAELGLLPRLDAVAVRTRELIYANRFGQEIWREPRGLDAGYKVPQFSIHRGRLQGVLRDAVIERLGRKAIRTGHAFAAFAQEEGAVKARFKQRRQRFAHRRWRATSWSAATASIPPCAGSSIRTRPASSWNGVLMWRGATNAKGFLDGRTMIVAGGFNNKLVLYPIGKGKKPGTQLVNWVVTYRMGDGSTRRRGVRTGTGTARWPS